MMFRRHMQDIRQRMDHFEQFGRSKGQQGFERFGGFGRRGGGRDRFFKKGNLQFTIYNFTNVRRGITSWLSNH